jgi:hypothetical protein
MADEDNELTKDLRIITNMAKRLKLEGADLSRYIHEHMTKLGYKAERTYTRPKSAEKKGSGFFGGGKSSDDDDDDDF